MATRKGINIFGHYVVPLNTTRLYVFSYMYFIFKKNKRSGRIVFYRYIF